MESSRKLEAERRASQRRLSAAVGEAERCFRRGFDEAFRATKEAARPFVRLTEVDAIEARRALFFAEASATRLRRLLDPPEQEDGGFQERNAGRRRRSLTDEFAHRISSLFAEWSLTAADARGNRESDASFAYLYDRAGSPMREISMAAGVAAAAAAALGVLGVDAEQRAERAREEAGRSSDWDDADEEDWDAPPLPSSEDVVEAGRGCDNDADDDDNDDDDDAVVDAGEEDSNNNSRLAPEFPPQFEVPEQEEEEYEEEEEEEEEELDDLTPIPTSQGF
jgi:hypothetical protein